MKEISLEYSGLVGPLSESRIERFEERLGRKLPPQYRQFLLATNGGVPRRPGMKFFNAVDEEEVETIFECYYPLHDEVIPDKSKWGCHISVEKVWETLQSNLPATTLVPIGRDVSGNLICIETASENEGKVFLWDHDYDETYPIAATICEFDDSLYEPDNCPGKKAPAVWVKKTAQSSPDKGHVGGDASNRNTTATADLQLDDGLVGVWKVVSVDMLSGCSMNLIAAGPGESVEFTADGRFIVDFGGRPFIYLCSTLPDGALDIWSFGMPKTKCRYVVDPGHLELCVAANQGERPTELRRDDNYLWVIYRLERTVKPKG